ncbi:MAG: lipopolysaccharide heptosyltransferase II [Kiritimatiellia bacterium]|jgi:heptosyltransferase-2|nr:lipopolysaccharide heptosyltransferase II [Kiritimatiellia bacterium]
MVTAAPPIDQPPRPPPRVLICGVNWLGDAILTMPALQAYRWENPDADLTLLVRPSLAPLWALHAAPTRVLTLPRSTVGLKPLAHHLRALAIETAYVLPHSVRSALPPWLARIPNRIGLPGHFPRASMLTEIRRHTPAPGRIHQVFEYLDLFFPGAHRRTFVPPSLAVPPPVLERLHDTLADLPRPWISLIPGAARGPSKQWPTEHYALAAAKLMAETGGSIITLGTEAEDAVCQQVAAAAAPNGMNLAGQTTLEELAGVLALSAGVLCNDSGGMHLAAALGTPLVALFGITDPERTGPLGRTLRILQHSELRSRDIPRHSAKAEKALRAIAPDEAVQALLPLLHTT